VNGFGWKLNEVVGAQIVSVPATVSSRLSDSALRAFGITLVCFTLASLVILNVLLKALVTGPLERITTAANQTPEGGGLQIDDIPVRGKDEIASLTIAVNWLRRRPFEKAPH
jgi:protein-histidine pros-kinase